VYRGSYYLDFNAVTSADSSSFLAYGIVGKYKNYIHVAIKPCCRSALRIRFVVESEEFAIAGCCAPTTFVPLK
jgi:hypothetical protein